MSEPVTIAAVLATYNEEVNIERCLRSLDGHVDEIIISDMHSTDRTVEICRRFTNKVGLQPRQPFTGKVRTEGVERASSDWLLIIDADEAAGPGLLAKLRELAESNTVDVVRIPRTNEFFGHVYTGRGWPRELIERFFRKGSFELLDHPHDWVKVHGRMGMIEPRPEWSIMHHGNRTIGDFIRKMNDYTDSEAKLMHSLGWPFDFKRAVLRPLRFFWEHFVTFKGYKSGAYGIVLACLWAVYWHVAALKLWELHVQASRQKNNP